MQWVTHCDLNTQIAINDTQFDNRLICRDFDYYVNPDSDSIIELGTKDHPYKQIAYAFVEILNYHSHTDRNLTIYLMEYTRNELPVGTGNIINITNVEIRPYTLRASVDPDKANIVGIDSASIVSNPATLFSILKSYEFRFEDMVTNYSDLTDSEKARAQLEKYLILALRSNLLIYNMEITSEYSSVFDDVLITYPVYLQTKTLTLRNLHMRISGTILRAFDPFNLVIENIDVDYYRNSGGVDMDLQCNYPEANIYAYAHVTNVTFYNSQTKVINPPIGAMLESELPGDFIITDYYWSNYVATNDQKGTTGLIIQATWLPNDAPDRFYNITNATIPILDQGLNVASNYLVTDISTELYRITDSYLENINWSNAYASNLPSIIFFGNLRSAIVMKNFISVNSSSFYSIQFFSSSLWG